MSSEESILSVGLTPPVDETAVSVGDAVSGRRNSESIRPRCSDEKKLVSDQLSRFVFQVARVFALVRRGRIAISLQFRNNFPLSGTATEVELRGGKHVER